MTVLLFTVAVFCLLAYAEVKDKLIRALMFSVGMVYKVWVLIFLILAVLKAM